MSACRETINVLLLEGNEFVLWGLKKLIDSASPHLAVTATARTLNEAFAAIRKHDPDVIVMDIYVGADNSLDHFDEIRNMSGAEIIVLTMSRDAELRRCALALGARAVVATDGPGDMLLDHIERAGQSGKRHAAPR